MHLHTGPAAIEICLHIIHKALWGQWLNPLLILTVAFVELVSAEVATVVEDDDQGMGSSVELCVELLLEPVLPVDRDVVVILDNEDVTTGDYMTMSLYKTLWCEKYYVKSTGSSLM